MLTLPGGVRSFALVACAMALVACARTRYAPHGYNISSETSYYSPVVRLAVGLPIVLDDGSGVVVVRIDSGLIRVPGKSASDSLPLVRDLFLKALLVHAAAPARRGRTGPPWRVIAQSDSVPIADSLRLGEERSLVPVTLRVRLDSVIDPGTTSLVFSVVGAGMTQEAQQADGRILPRRRVTGGVRVYACADWTIAGLVDRRRARLLARNYNTGC